MNASANDNFDVDAASDESSRAYWLDVQFFNDSPHRKYRARYPLSDDEISNFIKAPAHLSRADGMRVIVISKFDQFADRKRTAGLAHIPVGCGDPELMSDRQVKVIFDARVAQIAKEDSQ